jgi:hypothetical protein
MFCRGAQISLFGAVAFRGERRASPVRANMIGAAMKRASAGRRLSLSLQSDPVSAPSGVNIQAPLTSAPADTKNLLVALSLGGLAGLIQDETRTGQGDADGLGRERDRQARV